MAGPLSPPTMFVSFGRRVCTSMVPAMPPSTWEDVVGELTNHFASGTVTQGFIRAIERCGKILAKHFPPGTADKNELPNHLIVLDAYGRP